MPSEPRLIRGPCFDCDDSLDDGLRSTRKTAPTPKLDPETRPNVPPRMMS